MLNFISGRIVECGESYVVLECAGIGYELIASTPTLSACTVGEQTSLFCYLAVREDSLTLYGFKTKQERASFIQLISVSGIGPKVAINVLSSISSTELAIAIASGDSARLRRVKGLGAKTAERVILELKGKIATAQSIEMADEIAGEAILALEALGLPRSEAAARVMRIRCNASTVEEAIRLALK